MNGIFSLSNTVTLLISALIAIGVSFGLEMVKRPRIDIVEQVQGVGDEHGFRILHVQVFNRPWIRLPLRWIQVSPLYSARVHLSFLREGAPLFDDVIGIWSDRPRPLLGKDYDEERASEAQAVDLFARDQPWSVPVAIKLRGQEEAHGFHAESYRHPNRVDPRLRLPANAQIELRVRVVGGSPKQPEFRFFIRNFGPELQRFVIRRP